jgi:hypothetical protein
MEGNGQMISNTAVKLVRGNIVLLNIVLAFLLSESKTLNGIVTDLENGNKPISGALVSFDHTMFRTFTDSSGAFSLDIPEIGIGQSTPKKALSSYNLIYNQRTGSIILPVMGLISEFALYSLDGKEIVKKIVGENDTRIAVPKVSSGLFLIRLTFKNGDAFSSPILSTPVSMLQKVSFKTMYSETRKSGTLLNEHKIIFRHDNFFPVDRNIVGAGDTLLVGMEKDPRAIFFDDTKVHTMSFTLTNQDSLLMERSALEEEYVSAELVYNDVPIGNVGLRYKGSDYYAMPRCFDENGNRGSYKDCRNVSLKVKFDKYVDTTRLCSMKKLNLHSMSYDDSKMREMFAYKLFREMGIYTCRTAFVKVYVNNVYRGLFTAVESIDGRFTKSRWPEFGNGNLYKETWPWKLGVSYYNTALETNTNPGDSIWVVRMPDMARAILTSNPDNFKSKIAPFMDLDYFVNYIVVDRAIHNSDGIMAWYYQKSWQGNHNYFFYEEENTGGKAWIIPWDLNSTLYPTDPIIDDCGVPEWNVTPDSCKKPVLAWGGSFVIPPNCDKLIGLTAATCWDQFIRAGKYYLEKIFVKEQMHAYLDKLTTLIAPVMDHDPWLSKADWENNIKYFSASLDMLYSGFDDYLNGREPSIDSSAFKIVTDPDSGFSLSYCNNFEFEKPCTTLNWIVYDISKNSTINLTIDTLTPLWGKRSIKGTLVFNPADTLRSYAEWSYIGFSFKQPCDFTNVDSVKVCLKSDLPRGCWITLRSDVYEQKGVKDDKYGWTVMSNMKNRQLSLALSNAVYPEWANSNNPPIKDTVLTSVSGIGFNFDAQFDSDGKLRIIPDSGFVEIDNIEFIRKKP